MHFLKYYFPMFAFIRNIEAIKNYFIAMASILIPFLAVLIWLVTKQFLHVLGSEHLTMLLSTPPHLLSQLIN